MEVRTTKENANRAFPGKIAGVSWRSSLPSCACAVSLGAGKLASLGLPFKKKGFCPSWSKWVTKSCVVAQKAHS
jgi:hypothetical protein